MCIHGPWRDESARSLNTHGHVSTQVPNSPILMNNHELDSIEVNKDRIHGELRYSWGVLQNSIKLDDELRWEIRNFNIFRKITQRRIYKIKNHSIWIKIHEEIKEQK